MVVLINAYHYAWALGNSSYVCPDLKVAWKNKVTSATVAFVIADPGNPKKIWSQISACYDDMKAYVLSGGDLIISCGGANGPFLEGTMTEDEQFLALDQLIKDTGVMYLDFDVEGNEPINTQNNQQRANVIKRLQSRYSSLKVSYTIAVLHVSKWQQPIQTPELTLIYNAIQTGVKIDRINAMVMDTSYDISGNWGGTTVGIIEGMKTQLKIFFPKRSDTQIYQTIGITNMIGVNDNATIFTLKDAQVVIDYANLRQIGMVSYWALQRDQSRQGGLAVSSMVEQKDFAFWNILSIEEKGHVPIIVPSPNPIPVIIPVPVPVVVPSPSPVPVVVPSPSPVPVVVVTPPPKTVFDSWKVGVKYVVGNQITFGGRLYKCQIENTSIVTWEPPGVPALWIDMGSISNFPKDVQVNLPSIGKLPKAINMIVKVDFDQNGNALTSLLSSQIVY